MTTPLLHPSWIVFADCLQFVGRHRIHRHRDDEGYGVRCLSARSGDHPPRRRLRPSFAERELSGDVARRQRRKPRWASSVAASLPKRAPGRRAEMRAIKSAREVQSGAACTSRWIFDVGPSAACAAPTTLVASNALSRRLADVIRTV